MFKRRQVLQTTVVTMASLGLSAGLGSAQAWNRDAIYVQRVSELKRAIDARPNDANALVNLVAFYLKPLAPRTVEAADGTARTFDVPLRNENSPRIKMTYAVPWVFRGDTSAAWPLLTKALQLDPLRANPLDLDMCRLYLDHRTGLARVLNDQAADLRRPRIHDEQRPDGVYRITTQPSAADLARANQLDAQAQDARRDAIRPMQHLAGALRDDPKRAATPAKQAQWRLATGIYFQWIGELEKAAGTAAAGLREDPTCLDCLDYVVDLLRGTRTKDALAQYKAILDRWGGTDSSPVYVDDAPRGIRR